MNTKTFKIPTTVNLKFEKAVAKIQKRAAKHNWDFELKNLGSTFMQHPHFPIETNEEMLIEAVEYELTTGDLQIHDWNLLGSLDFATLPGSVLVNAAPGKEIPTHYHDHDGMCDHCNTKRSRKLVAILEDADGNTKAIGRACVRDYIGYDTDGLIRLYESVMSLESSFGDDCFAQVDRAFGMLHVLSQSAACIRTEGWVSKGKSEELESTPTASDVVRVLIPPRFFNDDDYRIYVEWCKKVKIIDADVELAQKAIEWIQTTETEDNNYLHNLAIICENEFVPTRLFGYWCSLIVAYNNAQDKITKELERKAAINNEHFGELKKRYELCVTVERKFYFETQFGGKHIVSMLDDQGRSMVWFGTNSLAAQMAVGSTYKVKATVKDHGEFRDVKQTTLTRVAAIK